MIYRIAGNEPILQLSDFRYFRDVDYAFNSLSSKIEVIRDKIIPVNVNCLRLEKTQKRQSHTQMF